MTMKTRFIEVIQKAIDAPWSEEATLYTKHVMMRFIKMYPEGLFEGTITYYLDRGWTVEDAFCGFHKQFRQADVYDYKDGHLDMLFWYFVHTSRIPQELFSEFYKEELIRKEREDGTDNS